MGAGAGGAEGGLPTRPWEASCLSSMPLNLGGSLHQDRAMRPGLPDVIYGPNYVAMPFDVPKPGTPLQAFVCATKASKNVRGPLALNERVARSSGFIAGNEPMTSLWDCTEWPFQIYEVLVDPADLFVGRGELLLKTSAFRVVREVPLAEVFGARAGELGPIFDDVRGFPWLAPKGSPDPDAIARLVREVYAIVAEHKKVRPLPIGIVTEWDGACDADQRVDALGSPVAWINAARDARRATRSEEDYEQLSLGTRVLRHILLRQSYARTWEAGWEASFNASLRASMKQRPGDAKAAKRTWARLREKTGDRHDAARRAAMRTAQEMLDATLNGVRTPGSDDDDSTFSEIRAAGVDDITTNAWNFSLSAMITAADVLETPVHEVECSPSKPLLELFRMGLWPIGEVGGLFIVYSPSAVSPQR